MSQLNLNDDVIDKWLFAIAEGDLQTVQSMIEEGFPVDTWEAYGDTPVINAIETDNEETRMELLRILLEAGASTEGAIARELTIHADPRVIDLLLEFGADINKMDTKTGLNDTPLQYALFLFGIAKNEDQLTSRYKMVLHLLDKGAKPTIYHEDTDPPITQWYSNPSSSEVHKKRDDYAVKLVKRMVLEGADVNVRGNGNRTALLIALVYDLPDTARTLLYKGADPNMESLEGFTPLRSAILQSDLGMVKTLWERGADLKIATLDGSTPLMAAVIQPNPKIVEYLLTKGADPNITTKKGTTALSLAANAGNLMNIDVLLKYGARITPLIRQNYHGYRDYVKRMLEQTNHTLQGLQPPQKNQTKVPPRRAYAGFGHGTTDMIQNPEYRDPAFYGPAEKKPAWERRPSIGKYVADTFVVPENCVVVLKGSPDALVNISEVNRIVQRLSTLDKNTLENPSAHLGNLTRAIGPVSIYGPGDQCPNVMYYFYPEFQDMIKDLQNAIKRERIMYTTRLSPQEKKAALQNIPKPGLFRLVKGLLSLPVDEIDVNEKTAILRYKGDEDQIGSRILVEDVIEYLYADSVLPRPSAVHDLFRILFGTKRYHSLTLDRVTEWDMQRLRGVKPLMYSQKELCDLLPGVYYYTVCRQYNVPEEEKESGWAYWHYTPNIQKSVNPAIVNVRKLPPHMQRIARNVIGEAETRRKGTVKRMYNQRRADAITKAETGKKEVKKIFNKRFAYAIAEAAMRRNVSTKQRHNQRPANAIARAETGKKEVKKIFNKRFADAIAKAAIKFSRKQRYNQPHANVFAKAKANQEEKKDNQSGGRRRRKHQTHKTHKKHRL